jgi:predicted homoserine dehydrogenase-like protein
VLRRALDLLDDRATGGPPLGVALVGAGAFGTMLLAQARRLHGLEVIAVADLSPARAREALRRAGWSEADLPSVTDTAADAIAAEGVDVVVEATGDAIAGVDHALLARQHGRHVVMVTVEADALAGPALAAAARDADLVYSLAYGDQPALVCELVDWARACGFDVVCAGKGTKYLPSYHAVTPDEIWEHYGLSGEDATASGYSSRMFTSFVDGTKSAIEMAAVCNATGLSPQEEGLRFPPAGADRLARSCIPEDAGGALSRSGTVEVVSSLERDGAPVKNDLRWGVFVTFAAASDYVAGCFADYGLATDDSGRFAALWRPYHLIGLEASVSVLAAGLLGEATGSPVGFRADVAAVAKRDLAAGESLDGEGGYTVYGTLVPAERGCAEGLLPIGLARGIALNAPVAAGQAVRYSDIEPPPGSTALGLRKELELKLTGPAPAAGSPPPTR